MKQLQSTLDQIVSSLKGALGDNLYSCCVYGSAVRGDAIEGVSDINLLILLNDSNPEAHVAIGKAIGKDPQIDPFILGRKGFERSVRAFAPKFVSIRRNYRVVFGADPLKEIKVEPELERFLCEQALRNLRLRLAHAFITREQSRRYPFVLARCCTPLLLRLSEVLRLNGRELAREMPARIPMLAQEFGIEEALLRDLVAFKRNPQKLSDQEMVAWHKRLFPAVDKALAWVEAKWPA
ncbi:MAG: hypothetical protein JWR69_422 [Pedosphaera sp.]|nr:hypothetical protein [Pedosphaera sp.]